MSTGTSFNGATEKYRSGWEQGSDRPLTWSAWQGFLGPVGSQEEFLLKFTTGSLVPGGRTIQWLLTESLTVRFTSLRSPLPTCTMAMAERPGNV